MSNVKCVMGNVNPKAESNYAESMESSPEALRRRTKEFAIRIIKLFRALPPANRPAQIIGNQLLRCGMSIGANYRAAGRARSRAEFAAKLGIVVEETDETIYWIELLGETEAVSSKRLESLLQEAHELVAIFTAARETARGR